ncbi:hypothetical protein FB45DRAFT_877618 [Roridomyces roridus]|uniref:Uncharacterized protein n=1 Tax=Roridomyces roridus TaxID=1738132 RepID=A0AAD7B2D7_9AGAR|nr:hypothetical protein FB45DRAFT_877618 [Roridomyces roridus]
MRLRSTLHPIRGAAAQGLTNFWPFSSFFKSAGEVGAHDAGVTLSDISPTQTATVVITHDDDWREILRSGLNSSQDSSDWDALQLLQRACQGLNVREENGLAMFSRSTSTDPPRFSAHSGLPGMRRAQSSYANFAQPIFGEHLLGGEVHESSGGWDLHGFIADALAHRTAAPPPDGPTANVAAQPSRGIFPIDLTRDISRSKHSTLA